jgi:hypothetical protein
MLETLAPRPPKTILVTFAGRRDRMSLLTRYVDRAIAEGLIDEWHVWDFSRNAADRLWLRQQFPMTQATPSNSLEYFRRPERVTLAGKQCALRFSVYGQSDVHVGLRPLGGDGASYEFVLGGWNNQASALRLFDDAAQLVDVARRDPLHRPLVVSATPGLLPEFGFAAAELDLHADEVRVTVQEKEALRAKIAIAPGDYELLYRTGFGSNGEWLFNETERSPARLFVRGPTADYPPGAMFYTNAYQYYGANRDRYGGDIFLKCDDDVVYMDLARLREFIEFRRRNPQFFLVSANVVNNGVCAYFQQMSGAVPQDFDAFEMPPGGMWGESAAASRPLLEQSLRFSRRGPRGHSLARKDQHQLRFLARRRSRSHSRHHDR